jgi:hypothetical protein
MSESPTVVSSEPTEPLNLGRLQLVIDYELADYYPLPSLHGIETAYLAYLTLLSERDLSKSRRMVCVSLSGYTDDAVVRRGVLAAETAFLQKPFTPVALANKVRQLWTRVTNRALHGKGAGGGGSPKSPET